MTAKIAVGSGAPNTAFVDQLNISRLPLLRLNASDMRSVLICTPKFRKYRVLLNLSTQLVEVGS